MGDDSSESDVDANLLAEEQRIREQYGLANPTASNEEGIDDEDGAGRRDSFDSDGAAEDGGDDVASSAIADQIRRLESESERLQEERDLLKEQVGVSFTHRTMFDHTCVCVSVCLCVRIPVSVCVAQLYLYVAVMVKVGNFEDLFQAMAPVDGEDPSKFMETIMVDGVERTQDYRDVKIRDLAKRAKALNVKLNALRESNDGKIKVRAVCQLLLDLRGSSVVVVASLLCVGFFCMDLNSSRVDERTIMRGGSMRACVRRNLLQRSSKSITLVRKRLAAPRRQAKRARQARAARGSRNFVRCVLLFQTPTAVWRC